MSIPVALGSNITLNAILNEIPGNGKLSIFSMAIISTLFEMILARGGGRFIIAILKSSGERTAPCGVPVEGSRMTSERRSQIHAFLYGLLQVEVP